MNSFFWSVLKSAVEHNASDIYLKADHPPMLRVHTQLFALEGLPSLPNDALKEACYSFCSDNIIKAFEHRKSITFSVAINEMGRFILTFYADINNRFSAYIRLLPLEPPTSLGDLGLSPVVKSLLQRPRGLLVVAGPPGSGKSTTLAAFVEHINKYFPRLVMMLDAQPLEFAYVSKTAIVTQLEKGVTFQHWEDGVATALRQNPDVLTVPTLDDVGTLQAALTAAESALVISTCPARTTYDAYQRLIGLAAPDYIRQKLVAEQLTARLAGVISLQLLPRINKPGVVCAAEIFANSREAQRLMGDGKAEQLPDLLTKAIPDGMEPMDFSLARLVHFKVVAEEAAYLAAVDPARVRAFIAGENSSLVYFDRRDRRRSRAPQAPGEERRQAAEAPGEGGLPNTPKLAAAAGQPPMRPQAVTGPAQPVDIQIYSSY